MSSSLEFCIDRGSVTEVKGHLQACNYSFVPPLSERIDLEVYARKIIDRAVRFEVWVDELLVGLIAAYCNDLHNHVAFITSVSVLPGWHGRGIASQLLDQCIKYVSNLGFVRITLEVDINNHAAVKLYEKHGFSIDNTSAQSIFMHVAL